MLSGFTKIDNPQENLTLAPEFKSQMCDAFAKAHIDKLDSLDEGGKTLFLSDLAKDLSVEEKELDNAMKDKKTLSALFSKLNDKDLVQFNWDKDGFAVIKPKDLSPKGVQEYCDKINFLGVMVVDDGKGNQTRISNYHKGTQQDPGDNSFATHSVSKLIGGVTICKMIADGIIPKEALDKKLELSEATKKELPEEILNHINKHDVTLRDVLTHKSGLGGYLDPELKEGQPRFVKGKLGYGVNGYSGYVRQQLEKGEEVVAPKSPQDYLKYAETETYEYGKSKYSDLGIMLASLSAEHHYNKNKKGSEHKSFEEIVKETLIIPAGDEKFSAQKPADAVCHSDDPIAPHITGTAGCGFWTNLDGMMKIGKQIYKMWQEDEAFKRVVKDCGQEFYDPENQIIKHPGGIDSSKTLLVVDLKNGSVVATEERRLGEGFPYPGWGIVTTVREKSLESSPSKDSPSRSLSPRAKGSGASLVAPDSRCKS